MPHHACTHALKKVIYCFFFCDLNSSMYSEIFAKTYLGQIFYMWHKRNLLICLNLEISPFYFCILSFSAYSRLNNASFKHIRKHDKLYYMQGFFYNRIFYYDRFNCFIFFCLTHFDLNTVTVSPHIHTHTRARAHAQMSICLKNNWSIKSYAWNSV